MRGKKKDPEFLSRFLIQCIAKGIDNPEDIVSQAKREIAMIDKLIQEAEQARLYRSKLLGVVESFEKPVKTSIPDEIKVLSFIDIQQSQICQSICLGIQDSPIQLQELMSRKQSDMPFAIKQLLEHKIISRAGNMLVRGDMFDAYLKFVSGGT